MAKEHDPEDLEDEDYRYNEVHRVGLGERTKKTSERTETKPKKTKVI